MSTVNLYLDTRSVRRDGTSPLKLSVNSKGRSVLVSLSVYLMPNQWDRDKQKVVSHPRKDFLNTVLHNRVLDAEEIVLGYQKEHGRSLPLAEVKRKIIELAEGPEPYYLYSYLLKKQNDPKLKKSTSFHYQVTIKKIKLYLEETRGPKIENLTFEAITHQWLVSFNDWLAANGVPSHNARTGYFVCIKAAFRLAINDGVTEHYPFVRFRVKHGRTRSRALALDDLRKVLLDDLIKPKWNKYRDMFKFMFCLCGMNCVDVRNLKMSDISPNGRLEYRRSKTGRFYSIMVPPEALEIIEKYHIPGDEYVFPIHTKNLNTYECNINRCLKKLRGPGEEYPWFPFLSTYYTRHSWATIAVSLDIPREVVGLVLGHKWVLTDIYIDYDYKKIDDANRKVLDWVFYGKK